MNSKDIHFPLFNMDILTQNLASFIRLKIFNGKMRNSGAAKLVGKYSRWLVIIIFSIYSAKIIFMVRVLVLRMFVLHERSHEAWAVSRRGWAGGYSGDFIAYWLGMGSWEGDREMGWDGHSFMFILKYSWWLEAQYRIIIIISSWVIAW